jgi:N-acetylmuramoyl-L-alanine amidase
MRKINRIFVHCSDTPTGRDVSAADIKRWHTDPKPKGNGWRDIGYSHVIRIDGTIELGRPVEQVGAHVAGHNSDSIGICLVGRDKFTY